MEDTSGAAHLRPDTTTCYVTSTPSMEAEIHRLRSTGLLARALGGKPRVSASQVSVALEQLLRLPSSAIKVAKAHPDDFLITFDEPHQRDLAFDLRHLPVRGFTFKLRPWLPAAPRSHHIWRFYCRVAIDKLPLETWEWGTVKRVLGDGCKLDRIEQRSLLKTDVSALYAWVWTWNPSKIPRQSDFTKLQRPEVHHDYYNMPEGSPDVEGLEGPQFPILIHLDIIKDYTPVTALPGQPAPEWPRVKDLGKAGAWEHDVKDTTASRHYPTCTRSPPSYRSDEDTDGSAGRRHSDIRGSGKRIWQAVRGQAQCRDVSSYNPEPRRHRRQAAVPTADTEACPDGATTPAVEAAVFAPFADHDVTMPLDEVSRPQQSVVVTPALEVFEAPIIALPNQQPEAEQEQVYTPSDAHSSSAPVQTETLHSHTSHCRSPKLLPLMSRPEDMPAPLGTPGCTIQYMETQTHTMLLYSPPRDQLHAGGWGGAFTSARALTGAGVAPYCGWTHDNSNVFDNDTLGPKEWYPWGATTTQLTGILSPPRFVDLPSEVFSTPLPATQVGLPFSVGPQQGTFREQISETLFGPGAMPASPPRQPTMPIEEQRARAALADAGLTGVGLLEALTARVSDLQIDEQRAFIAKMAALLSPSLLGAAPTKALPPPRAATFKRKLFGSVKGSRKSTRLRNLRSSFSSSWRSQAAICKQLGLIDKEEDFTDETLLDYINLFKGPIPPTSIAMLTKIAGLSSPSQLRLPDAELQALLEEFPGRSS
jgi:hypothetical protein